MESEVQFVVSVLAVARGVWKVKLGLEEVGRVHREGDRYVWRCVDAEGAPARRRIEAVLDLLEHVYEESSDDDRALEEELEISTARYEDPTTGRRIVLYRCQMQCTSCGETLPASQIGLRKINDLLYRSQPQCKRCRSRRNGQDADSTR